MKTKFIIVICALLCGCSSMRQDAYRSYLPVQTPADTAKQMFWQLQQPSANIEEAPHYRRLTITLPARTEDGVNYEPETRTILIAE